MNPPKKGQIATRIVGCDMARITQKEFIEAVREIGNETYLCGVSYQHPGLFQVGKKKIRLDMPKVSKFLAKLSTVMNFNHYDILTKSIWVASLKASNNAIAEKRPEFTVNQSNENHPKPL